MKHLLSLSVVTVMLLSASVAQAEGLKAGDKVGAFKVVKCAGNEADSFDVMGKPKCYRCMLGNRPTVAIFTRTDSGKVVDLIKELDSVVADNSDAKLASYVNLLGDDKTKLEASGKALVKSTGAKNIAMVIPTNHKEGPGNYKIPADAETVVILHKGGKVVATHTYKPNGMCGGCIKGSISETKKMASK